MPPVSDFTLACPIPISDYPHVLLAHGSGGRLMHDLIARMFAAGFDGLGLDAAHDAAVVPVDGTRLAVTTDSFVVHPLQFPGGDIGSLAVYGTVNDLAMSGAQPRYLSVGFILEEGLPMETLWQIVCSMRDAAERAGVHIVTGDTKVVDKGSGDGCFINTTGLGTLAADRTIAPGAIQPGDAILVSGDLGRHGIAIMATREGLTFESAIESDAAPLHAVVRDLLDDGLDVRCLRDLTRGGLSSALNEIAEASGYELQVDERQIPVREDVRGACEMLGLDPLYVANEGRFVAFVPAAQAERALAVMQAHPVAEGARQIGTVGDDTEGDAVVTLTSSIGVERILDMLSGAQLPRIC
ncbi:MAG: hydrogenase expression/formation protein HypE [Bacteroidetes bacterium]|jgi:hydrogenase expression/formation protein HypE|nr:hydrogenase expression/formation protein HypE [Bacteroidota bacterium]